MPPLRRGPDRDVRRSGDVTALRELRAAPRSWTRPRPSTRCTSGCARRACSSSSPLTWRARTSSPTTLYFSSYSDSWVAHAKRYADAMTDRLGLTPDSLVIEVASNDGYLLQHFVARGHPRRSASSRPRTSPRRLENGHPDGGRVPRGRDRPRDRGRARTRRPGRRQQRLRARPRHPRLRGGTPSARQGLRSCHPRVPPPAPPDRTAPVRHDLPRALPYLSLLTASRALGTAGLRVVDVDELATHGGSLRVYATPDESAGEPSPAREGSPRRGRARGPAHARRARRFRRVRS